MSITMTAKKTFTNIRVTGPRPDGSIVAGDTFTTDWDHAKDLARLGLATADDATALETEPHDLVKPHNQISVSELAATNARRANARGDKPSAAPVAGATAPAVSTAPAVTKA
ncbi:hypothetical protein [Lichenihabitans psoromatis]|uniref:hypothetical protein n=1 Tax=Lichenihabitans psoromatis TaxID=2528642 RepID=UPI0010384C2B|nr:hypothetical protein [Lichenihabitans psoromatis]